jgi:hypothetical protein
MKICMTVSNTVTIILRVLLHLISLAISWKMPIWCLYKQNTRRDTRGSNHGGKGDFVYIR